MVLDVPEDKKVKQNVLQQLFLCNINVQVKQSKAQLKKSIKSSTYQNGILRIVIKMHGE